MAQVKSSSPSTSTLVLANWKMNLAVAETEELARGLVAGKKNLNDTVELVLCPTFPALSQVAKIISHKGIALGAQDVFWKPVGPYTGEVSPLVLRELGVRYVLVGHSERRQYLQETDAMVRQKVGAVLAEGLVPVVCVGETFAERQVGQKDIVIARQVTAALNGIELTLKHQLVIAYEPVWVIGSGQAVAPEEAFTTARVIRQNLLDVFPAHVVDNQVRIIYGGSVDPSNIASFVNPGVLSGVLVGGASLDPKKFLELLQRL